MILLPTDGWKGIWVRSMTMVTVLSVIVSLTQSSNPTAAYSPGCLVPVLSPRTDQARMAPPAKLESAMRILGAWPLDFATVTPSGRIPEEDSVVAAVKDSLGDDAGVVLVSVMRGTAPYRIKNIAGTVYARLGLPPLFLEEVLQTLNAHDSASVSSSAAAFRGLSLIEARRNSVSPSRAYFVCSVAELVGKDSGSVYLARVLVHAISTLKAQRRGGSEAATALLESPEVRRALDWLQAHRYDIGR